MFSALVRREKDESHSQEVDESTYANSRQPLGLLMIAHVFQLGTEGFLEQNMTRSDRVGGRWPLLSMTSGLHLEMQFFDGSGRQLRSTL